MVVERAGRLAAGPARAGAGVGEGVAGDQGDRPVVDPEGRVEGGREPPGDLDGLGRGDVAVAQGDEVGVEPDRAVEGGLEAERLPPFERPRRDRRAGRRSAGSHRAAPGRRPAVRRRPADRRVARRSARGVGPAATGPGRSRSGPGSGPGSGLRFRGRGSAGAAPGGRRRRTAGRGSTRVGAPAGGLIGRRRGAGGEATARAERVDREQSSNTHGTRILRASRSFRPGRGASPVPVRGEPPSWRALGDSVGIDGPGASRMDPPSVSRESAAGGLGTTGQKILSRSRRDRRAAIRYLIGIGGGRLDGPPGRVTTRKARLRTWSRAVGRGREGYRRGRLARAAGPGVLALAGCQPSGGGQRRRPAKPAPPGEGRGAPKEADLATVTLTADAETRLGVVTAAVVRKPVPRTTTYAGEVMVPSGRLTAVTSPFVGTSRPPRRGHARRPARRSRRGSRCSSWCRSSRPSRRPRWPRC